MTQEELEQQVLISSDPGDIDSVVLWDFKAGFESPLTILKGTTSLRGFKFPTIDESTTFRSLLDNLGLTTSRRRRQVLAARIYNPIVSPTIV